MEHCDLKKLSFSLGLMAALVANSQASSINWATGYDSALKLAKSSHKLLMVDFWATWCTGCKELDRKTYKAPSVVSRSEAFVPVKLNAEKDGMPQVARYGITVFPTILFLKPNGDLVWKVEGYVPAEQFVKQMENAQQIGTQLPKYEALYRRSGSSPELAMKMVSIYSGIGSLTKIKSVLDAIDANPPAGPSSYLGRANNSGGDAFLFAQKLDAAMHYFRMAEQTGKPPEIAYARFNIAQCYLSNGDVDNAKPALEKLLAMGSVADPYRKQANGLLKDMAGKKAG